MTQLLWGIAGLAVGCGVMFAVLASVMVTPRERGRERWWDDDSRRHRGEW